jgi:endonuclease G
VRVWVYQTNHKFQIYAGPIYDQKDTTIGANRVVVPHAFYKMVTDTDAKQTLAFVFPHVETSTGKLADYQVTPRYVETATGITFNIPDDKMQINAIWGTNLKAFMNSKSAGCSIN